uniref:inorganic diphosphatase n=1 Tax=Alexandrium monilatum TaxID=311494 RepID=A0A7S4T4F9_9DINO
MSKSGDRSSLDVALSVAAVAAQLATAGAMAYTVHKMVKMVEGLQKEPSKPPVSRRSSSSFPLPENAQVGKVPGFNRQVSVSQLESHKTAVALAEESGKHLAVAFERKGEEALIIKDTAEAVTAMKAVFKRLCKSSKELLSCNDVEKVHNLLGEPMDSDEVEKMHKFFGAEKSDDLVVSFDMFMGWWSKLHDSSADPDQYYSQERYRQRFKVLQSRLKDPNISKISTVTEGEITSRRYRVHFKMDNSQLSPWHDIPLKNADNSYNFICEIPKWTRKKFEIATAEHWNPIKQDVKNGVLREYKWGDMLFNYGAFPQTWEDPKVVNEDTGFPGDNDPVDVIELGTRQRPVGSITRVKIVGVIAMIDSDETDWKVLAVALDDDKANNIHDLQDLDAHMPGVTQALTHWLQFYKTAEGKGENKFGFGGKPQSAAFATKIVEETHQAWRQLVAAASSQGKMKKVMSGGNIFTDLTVDGED